MTYVAVCALLVASVAILSAAGLMRSLVRQHARERMLLLDQMMHLAGRTWTPPPVANVPDVDELVYADPTQQPDWE